MAPSTSCPSMYGRPRLSVTASRQRSETHELGVLDAATRGQLDDLTSPLLQDVLDTGLHDPRLGFTTAYFHLPAELGDELRSAGFFDVDVYGVEGPMWIALDVLGMEHLDDLLPSALACARALERDRDMIAASAHLLALARR